MISAGYIGGGQVAPTPPAVPAPVMGQPAPAPIPTAGANSTNGTATLPMGVLDWSKVDSAKVNAQADAITGFTNAQTKAIAKPEGIHDPNVINGILGLGNQILQFVDGWWKANIADKLATLQDSYRQDMRVLEDKRLDNANALGNRQLEVTEKLSNNAKEAEETKARNQRLGAVEIARIQEEEKTKRAALGVTDEDFGRRGYSNYGFPVS